MGKVGKVIAGAVLVVAAGVIGVMTNNWQLALNVASVGVGLLTAPKPPNLNARQGRILENRAGALDRLPVVYGTARIAGVFADIRVDPASSQRKRLVLALAYCHGSRDGGGITAIDEVWFDDRLALQGTVMSAPFTTYIDGPPTRRLEYEHHLGSTTQPVDARLNQLFPVDWPSTSTGKGVCYSRFELWADNDIYPGGIPNIQVKLRGNRVYDPRDATWKHSDNPVLCIRDYLLSTVYGLGIPEAQVDDTSFIAMANYCDELVTIPGGTQKRFTLNGWVDTTQPVEQNLAELCTSCRAQVVNEGDRWRIIIRRQRYVPTFAITPENTVQGSWQFVLPGSDTIPNVVRVSYIEPERKYDIDTVQWPEPGQPNPYLTEDNGFEQRVEMELPYTQNRLMAQQLGMLMLRESRQGIGVVVTLHGEALTVRVGDLVTVTNDTPGWSEKLFDVLALQLLPTGNVQAVLGEYDDSVYDLEEQFAQPAFRDTSLVSPFSVAAPTSIVLTSVAQELQTNDGRYVPRIRVTWGASNHPFVEYYEIQAKRATDSEWDTYGRINGAADLLFYVYPVTDEEWDVRVRAVNTLGVASAWTAASLTVTTPDPRPQVLSVTLAYTHTDVSHTDTHSDTAHADAAHTDTHSDTVHADHTDHADVHSDNAGHDDVAHDDSHSDVGMIDTDHTDTHGDAEHSDHSDGHADAHTDSDHQDTAHDDSHGDVGLIDTDHTDAHTDNAHADHTDSGLSHSDVAHVDAHTDTAHSDTAHADGHVDSAHGDGQFGIGVAVQADTDTASLRAIARKHGDHSDGSHADVTEPTEAEVRSVSPTDGRNAVIALVDAATGSPIELDPGDQVRVGVLAYSEAGAGGVEGPLALASLTLFTVAPVGTDKWVPS